MRLESANSAKGYHKGAKQQKEPRLETHLRILWECFRLYKGEPVDVSWWGKPSNLSVALIQLRDFYGLDIRKTTVRLNAGKKGGHSYKYALVGEWFGSEYRDYLATKIPGTRI
jgi:hypothetical protein